MEEWLQNSLLKKTAEENKNNIFKVPDLRQFQIAGDNFRVRFDFDFKKYTLLPK